jgi:uncharacterized protein YjbJ (UPF0337 family)
VSTENKENHASEKKSSRHDKNEGTMDKVKGKAKEAAGAVSGDKGQKSEGRSD